MPTPFRRGLPLAPSPPNCSRPQAPLRSQPSASLPSSGPSACLPPPLPPCLPPFVSLTRSLVPSLPYALSLPPPTLRAYTHNILATRRSLENPAHLGSCSLCALSRITHTHTHTQDLRRDEVGSGLGGGGEVAGRVYEDSVVPLLPPCGFDWLRRQHYIVGCLSAHSPDLARRFPVCLSVRLWACSSSHITASRPVVLLLSFSPPHASRRAPQVCQCVPQTSLARRGA